MFSFSKSVILIVVFILLSFIQLTADKKHTAPLKPEYIKYKNDHNKSRYKVVPSPVSVAPSEYRFYQESVQLPAKFDLRDAKRITGVRDQGQYYTCWLFSASGSLESNLMPDNIFNMSERHGNENHGFDIEIDQGGTAWMTTAYFVRWDGPYKEADYPYYSRSAGDAASVPAWHVQDVIIAPERRDGTDNSAIKEIIMKNGAIDFALLWEDTHYSSSKGSYYYNLGKGQNHRMTMIGWDDNYPASNFTFNPPGNGAFIARNSWGTKWGMSGYCYISYYDTSLEEFFCYSGIEKNSNYYNIYQYDKLGVTRKVGNGYNRAANIFTATEEESLKAAGFYTLAPDTQVEIWVYTGCTDNNPASGSLSYHTNREFTWPGYHTLKFETPVDLKKDEKFSIIVRYQSPHSSFNIGIESPDGDYSSKADGQAGQSFISSNGTLWRDLTNLYNKSNVCIKGYTGTDVPEINLSGKLESASSWLVSLKKVKLTITLSSSPDKLDKLEIVHTNQYGGENIVKTVNIDGRTEISEELIPKAGTADFVYHLNMYKNGRKLGESNQVRLD